ncbi:transaldolase family protein [bacterium RCC_150]
MTTFFIDSADRNQVTRLLSTGLFGGVTTNPEILSNAGLGSNDIPTLVDWATGAGAKRVFVQSWGKTTGEIAERGQELRNLGSNVTVKVPASRQGIEAAKILSGAGPVLVTAVYTAAQVLPIIASDASYLAPFVGRMIAAGRDAVAEITRMQQVIDATKSDLEILAGSLRTPSQVLDLASAGVRNVTLGPPVWDLFFNDELTHASVERFEELATQQPAGE